MFEGLRKNIESQLDMLKKTNTKSMQEQEGKGAKAAI